MNLTVLPLAMSKIVKQTGTFGLSMTTDLGEGKLNSNLLNSIKN